MSDGVRPAAGSSALKPLAVLRPLVALKPLAALKPTAIKQVDLPVAGKVCAGSQFAGAGKPNMEVGNGLRNPRQDDTMHFDFDFLTTVCAGSVLAIVLYLLSIVLIP